MKTILYILLFNFSAISFAQDPILFETDWFLMDLIVDGANVTIPNNGEIGNIPLDFIQIGFSTQPCNLLNMEIEDLTNSDFTTSRAVIYEYNCSFPDTYYFEEVYFMDFFHFDMMGLTFNYALEIGANDTRMLTITNIEGDIAIYGNAALSVDDSPAAKVSIYPNPVKDKLFLSTKSALGNLKIKIFNIEGKLLSTQITDLKSQTSIDVSSLKSGIYFLYIEDGTRETDVTRFVKE